MTHEENLIVENLVTKFPDFGELWDLYLEDEIIIEGGYINYISLYSVATEFSEYIITLYNNNETEKLSMAFSEIELMATKGSEHVSEVALVGFIEGVLILRSHKGISLNAFDPWLGQTSKEFWYGMHDFFTNGPNGKNN